VPVCVDFYFYLFLKTSIGNILLHATVSAMDCTPNVVSKRCFSLYLSIPGLRKGPGKFSHRGSGKSWIFFQWKSGNPADLAQTSKSHWCCWEGYQTITASMLLWTPAVFRSARLPTDRTLFHAHTTHLVTGALLPLGHATCVQQPLCTFVLREHFSHLFQTRA